MFRSRGLQRHGGWHLYCSLLLEELESVRDLWLVVDLSLNMTLVVRKVRALLQRDRMAL